MNYQLGLIGYPVQHSLSPWIHESFLKQADLNGSYPLFEIKPHQFLEQMEMLKAREIHGFNVTVPYKQKIIPFLDSLHHEAKNIGAVNTVLNQNGKWIGYNTDGMGYLQSLRDHFSNTLKNLAIPILIIGAGGAARSIYYTLSYSGYEHVDIANRTKEKARDLKALKQPNTITNILSLSQAEESLSQYGMIIQTTNVGMKPNSQKCILSLDKILEGTIASDIVYQPIMTKFLKNAINKGATPHFGHTMLLNQAKIAFEIWTNKEVTVTGMNDKLKSILEGK